MKPFSAGKNSAAISTSCRRPFHGHVLCLFRRCLGRCCSTTALVSAQNASSAAVADDTGLPATGYAVWYASLEFFRSYTNNGFPNYLNRAVCLSLGFAGLAFSASSRASLIVDHSCRRLASLNVTSILLPRVVAAPVASTGIRDDTCTDEKLSRTWCVNAGPILEKLGIMHMTSSINEVPKT